MNKLINHKFMKYSYDEFELVDDSGEMIRARREVLTQPIFAWQCFNDQNWISIESMKEIDELEKLFQEWKSNSL